MVRLFVLSHRRVSTFCCVVAPWCLVLEGGAVANACKWNVGSPSSVLLDVTPTSASELSGVAYVGPSLAAGRHRFVAAQASGAKLVFFDVEFSPAGQLMSAATVSSQTLGANLDFEGIAYAGPQRSSVWLAEENSPGVREIDLATGNMLQSLTIPCVFANRRANRGFESLARTLNGATLWTANEDALAVDGPSTTASAGGVVRLLQFQSSGISFVAAAQFAYAVEKIHGSSSFGGPQSGLSDLAAFPDGTLLALERSVAVTSPLYLSRIYEIDFAGATDVSQTPWSAGLGGNAHSPVGKTLLWSGAADGGSGPNLEGLTLGPRLANGDWTLLGVVDDGGADDPVSMNTIVAFRLSANASADCDADRDVDGADWLAWQRGQGLVLGAERTQSDADRDGDVDAADLDVWTAGAGVAAIGAAAVPEPTGPALALLALALLARGNRWPKRSPL